MGTRILRGQHMIGACVLTMAPISGHIPIIYARFDDDGTICEEIRCALWLTQEEYGNGLHAS